LSHLKPPSIDYFLGIVNVHWLFLGDSKCLVLYRFVSATKLNSVCRSKFLRRSCRQVFNTANIILLATVITTNRTAVLLQRGKEKSNSISYQRNSQFCYSSHFFFYFFFFIKYFMNIYYILCKVLKTKYKEKGECIIRINAFISDLIFYWLFFLIL